jgi:hypothetical protein
VQSADPALPRHGLSALQLPTVAVTQPFPSLVQCVNDVSLVQTLPAVAPMHAAGGAGHLQLAPPAAPEHDVPLGHVAEVATARHPLVLRSHVTTCVVPTHTSPITPLHSLGSSHEHDASG